MTWSGSGRPTSPNSQKQISAGFISLTIDVTVRFRSSTFRRSATSVAWRDPFQSMFTNTMPRPPNAASLLSLCSVAESDCECTAARAPPPRDHRMAPPARDGHAHEKEACDSKGDASAEPICLRKNMMTGTQASKASKQSKQAKQARNTSKQRKQATQTSKAIKQCKQALQASKANKHFKQASKGSKQRNKQRKQATQASKASKQSKQALQATTPIGTSNDAHRNQQRRP